MDTVLDAHTESLTNLVLVDASLFCGVLDVSSFGGPTKEYQVDPNKLVAHSLGISQVEQQLGSNNANGGGELH